MLQWGLTAIFVCLTLLIFLPSLDLLTSTRSSVQDLPKAPQPPQAPKGKLDDATLAVYAQQVAAYQTAVTAFNTQMQVIQKSDRMAAYQLVVKDTLLTVFGTTLASFITFAFVSVAAQVRDNHNRMRNNREPQKISLFG